jgi:hypothetical protein
VKLPVDWKQEREDVLTLLAASVLIPLGWVLTQGWKFGFSASGGDTTLWLLPILNDLTLHGGDWTQILYRAEWAGGAKVHDISGILLIYEWMAKVGFGPVTSLNVSVFFIQVLVAFFGVRFTEGLLERYWNGGGEKRRPGEATLDWPSRIGLILLTAFVPVLGWRIYYGHLHWITGIFVFLVAACLIVSSQVGRVSWSLILVSLVALVNAFPSTGQQLIVYSAVFGGPILLGLAWPNLTKANRDLSLFENLRPLLLPVLVLLSGLALSMPKLAGMFANAVSSDALRPLGGDSVVYSYTTATATDWLSSLLWAKELIPTGRTLFLQHETNYAFGPSIAFLFFFPWSRFRSFGVGLGISVLLALSFSMDVPPFNSLLPDLIPPLKSFRVPARAMLPFTMMLPWLASFVILARLSFEFKWPDHLKHAAIAGVLMIFLLVLPPAGREVLAWLIAACGISGLLIRRKKLLFVSGFLLLFVLASASVSAFRERKIVFASEEFLLKQIFEFGQIFKGGFPELDSSLTRVEFNFRIPYFSDNTAYHLGLSSLDAYGFPPKRFAQLWSAIQGEPLNPMQNKWNLDESSKGFSILRQLYNIRYAARKDGTQVTLQQLGPTLGPAWFSSAFERSGSFDQIARSLHEAEDRLMPHLSRVAYLIEGDGAIPIEIQCKEVNPVCQFAQVMKVSAPIRSQRFELDVNTPRDCPLTVAMNYVTTLESRGVDSEGNEVELQIYPVYGALTGVWVPASVKKVIIQPRVILPLWSRVAWVMGWLLLAAALFRAVKDHGTDSISRSRVLARGGLSPCNVR